MMNKIIIPGLVSFDTKLNKIKGFNLSEDFNFYKSQPKKEKFHYSLIIKDDIEIPKSYDFRNGYYFKKDEYWYYERKILPGISLKFKYDPKNKIFYFNKIYTMLPFELGGILPIGRHISEFINLDLFLNDYNIFRGCAYNKNNKTICIIAPGYNGKTSLIKDVIKNKGKYIAEDILMINFNENKVFPTSPHTYNYFRNINKKLKKDIELSSVINQELNINKLYFLQNSIKSKIDYKTNKDILDFLLIGSLFFLNNPFLRSFIAEEGLSKEVLNKIEKLKDKNINYKFVKLKNFKMKK